MGENVKHFSLEEKNDNTYGWPWNEVVKTFLQSHYNDEEKQCSIKIRNKEYKILKRESVTVFYDADGNTLFDVTNDRLEKEYESGVSDAEEELENNVPVEPMGEIIEETKQEAFEAVISEGEKNTKTEDFVLMGTASLADIVGGLPTPTDETIKKAEDENAKPLKQRAKEKLEGEFSCISLQAFLVEIKTVCDKIKLYYIVKKMTVLRKTFFKIIKHGKSAMAIFTSRRENRKVEIVLWFGMMWFTNGQKIISIWMIKPLKKRKRKRKKSGERVRSKKLRNASNRTPNRSLAKKRHRKRHRMRNR